MIQFSARKQKVLILLFMKQEKKYAIKNKTMRTNKNLVFNLTH